MPLSSAIKAGKYRHYKGGLYNVLGVARNTETLEELVVYEQLYEAKDFPRGTLWARPLKMFLEKVLVDGVEKPRFELVKTVVP